MLLEAADEVIQPLEVHLNKPELKRMVEKQAKAGTQASKDEKKNAV